MPVQSVISACATQRRQSYAQPVSGRRRLALGRLLALALLAVPLGACSSLGLDTLFGQKDEILPDEPADRIYNEGLFLLNNKRDFREAAKRFEEVDRQHPY